MWCILHYDIFCCSFYGVGWYVGSGESTEVVIGVGDNFLIWTGNNRDINFMVWTSVGIGVGIGVGSDVVGEVDCGGDGEVISKVGYRYIISTSQYFKYGLDVRIYYNAGWDVNRGVGAGVYRGA